MKATNKFTQSIKTALPGALKTAWWVVKITVLISFAVTLLNYFGIVAWFSKIISPAFSLIGLPGEAALAYISGYFVNVYSAIAIIDTIDLSYRAITILAVMCLCSHNMILESAVQHKTGSSLARIFFLRTFAAFASAFVLNLILPASTEISQGIHIAEDATLWTTLEAWAISTLKLCAKMVTLIVVLSILQRLLAEFGVIRILSKIFRPLLFCFGLPAKTSFLWIVANTLGLAYGAAVMIEESEQGKINDEDADLLNHHIAVSHSNLEDLLLFASIGASIFWMLAIRLIFAFVFVWERRLELRFFKKKAIT